MTRSPSGSSLRWPTAPPRRGTLSLIVIAALGLGAGIVLTRGSAPQPLLALAGALLAFGLPGMALSRAMFAGPGMGRAERIALVIGIQLSLIVVCGFLLHLLRPGISPASWGSLLADITLVACAIAWLRSRGPAAAQASRPRAVTRPGSSWKVAIARASTGQLLMLVAAGLVAALALVVARAGVAMQPQTPWTALSIEAAEGGRAVTLRVANAEGHPETYHLVVTIDGEPLTTIDTPTLADGATWTQTIELPPAGAFLRQVDVSLWRAADPLELAAYRSVRLSSRGVPGP